MGKSYPIFLNLVGMSCVVIGAGRVAERKTAALLARGAQVKVISPVWNEQFTDWKDEQVITLLPRRFQPDDLKEAGLVIAATDDPAVNLQVYQSRGIHQWINVVDRPDLCTFTVPAVLERGALQIAITTGGHSPGFAGKLKEKLAQQIGKEYADHVEFLGELRREILATVPHLEERRRMLARLVEDDLLHMTLNAQWEERDRTARQVFDTYGTNKEGSYAPNGSARDRTWLTECGLDDDGRGGS